MGSEMCIRDSPQPVCAGGLFRDAVPGARYLAPKPGRIRSLEHFAGRRNDHRPGRFSGPGNRVPPRRRRLYLRRHPAFPAAFTAHYLAIATVPAQPVRWLPRYAVPIRGGYRARLWNRGVRRMLDRACMIVALRFAATRAAITRVLQNSASCLLDSEVLANRGKSSIREGARRTRWP